MTANKTISDSTTTVYLCEDSLDGIFSAIYTAWEAGTSHTDVRVKNTSTMSFFEEYVELDTDYELSAKVSNSIIRKLSYELYYYVYCACMSDDAGKASYVYKFLQRAFRIGPGVIDMLTDSYTAKICELKRAVSNEACRYREFVRFEELDNGVLAGRIAPTYNIIAMIANHFADRMPCENWIIIDTSRNLSVVHVSGKGYILTTDISEDSLFNTHSYSDDEDNFQSLWKRFFDTIAIKERINPKLQRNLMPLKCRTYMKAERG